ncbi:5 flap endonuclease [Moniliophthora roreri MCA 2997]|nr:5 flap endonuclease [Moniliophthora roreri MCA 2997]
MEADVTPLPDEPLPFEVSKVVASLYSEYRKSIFKVTSIYHASRQTTSAPDSDAEAAKAEYEISKTQAQLTVEEGNFWDTVAALFDSRVDLQPIDGISPSDMLTTLTKKSFLLSEIYKRSSRPPTSQQYNESKELIKAMGVTCIDTEGAVEAEAVAASLVLNGHADYVASEDTDVLIYEAPLVRNITNRREPLTVVSGADVRTMLQLTRDMYIDFALLLGTDFSQRIKNIGPARALKFIRTYGSIEKMIESEKKYSSSLAQEEYLQQVDAGRSVFQTLPPVPQAIFQREKADEVQTNFLMGKYGLASELEDYWEHALEGNYFNDNPSGM